MLEDNQTPCISQTDDRHIHKITNDFNNWLIITISHCDNLMNYLSEFQEYNRKIPLLHEKLQFAISMVQAIAKLGLRSGAGLRITPIFFYAFLRISRRFFYLFSENM